MQLEELGYEAKAVVKGNSIVVVTDENVEKLYLNRCMQSLKCAGFDVYSFVIPPGEESKSGMQYLKADHMRGNEPETMIVSQIEVMEQQELVF